MARIAPVLLCSVFVLMVLHHCTAGKEGKKGKGPLWPFGKSSGNQGTQNKVVPPTKGSKSNSTAGVAGIAGPPSDQLSGAVGGYPQASYVDVPGGGPPAKIDWENLEMQRRVSGNYNNGFLHFAPEYHQYQ